MVNLNRLSSQPIKKHLKDKKIVVGLSGGLDSVVLLHWLVKHYPKNKIRAIHINHQISQNATTWQDFCISLTQELGVSIECFKIKVGQSNIEHDARVKRYEIFKNILLPDEYLCTAHHQNDQAETLLLQLFRGAGSAGLASMPQKRPLGNGFLYRPLLETSKKQIQDYAHLHQLNWCEDESNKNSDFRRNFIRLELMPKLNEKYQNITKALSRSAKHQAESNYLLEILASKDIQDYDLLKNNHLQVNVLLSLETVRIKNILRWTIKQLGWTLPSEKVLNEMIVAVLMAKKDANPIVNWQNYQLRRFQNNLYFIDTKKINSILKLSFEDFKQKSSFEKLLEIDFKVGYRQTHNNKKSLKKYFQKYNIPPWERDDIPLYYIKNKLYAIGVNENCHSQRYITVGKGLSNSFGVLRL